MRRRKKRDRGGERKRKREREREEANRIFFSEVQHIICIYQTSHCTY